EVVRLIVDEPAPSVMSAHREVLRQSPLQAGLQRMVNRRGAVANQTNLSPVRDDTQSAAGAWDHGIRIHAGNQGRALGSDVSGIESPIVPQLTLKLQRELFRR